MNANHILGKKRNRLSRCRKRLVSGEVPGAQLRDVEARASELEMELLRAKKK